METGIIPDIITTALTLVSDELCDILIILAGSEHLYNALRWVSESREKDVWIIGWSRSMSTKLREMACTLALLPAILTYIAPGRLYFLEELDVAWEPERNVPKSASAPSIRRKAPKAPKAPSVSHVPIQSPPIAQLSGVPNFLQPATLQAASSPQYPTSMPSTPLSGVITPPTPLTSSLPFLPLHSPTSPVPPPRLHSPPAQPTLLSQTPQAPQSPQHTVEGAESPLHEKIHIHAQALAQEILRQESRTGVSSKRNPFEQWVDYLGPFNITESVAPGTTDNATKRPSNPFLDNL